VHAALSAEMVAKIKAAVTSRSDPVELLEWVETIIGLPDYSRIEAEAAERGQDYHAPIDFGLRLMHNVYKFAFDSESVHQWRAMLTTGAVSD
jgi:hypothetical protein